MYNRAKFKIVPYHVDNAPKTKDIVRCFVVQKVFPFHQFLSHVILSPAVRHFCSNVDTKADIAS